MIRDFVRAVLSDLAAIVALALFISAIAVWAALLSGA